MSFDGQLAGTTSVGDLHEKLEVEDLCPGRREAGSTTKHAIIMREARR